MMGLLIAARGTYVAASGLMSLMEWVYNDLNQEQRFNLGLKLQWYRIN